MVSFFKRRSSGDLSNSYSPSATIKPPRVIGAPETPETPPITPEPESPPDSNLQVLIVAEPIKSRSGSILEDFESESIESSSFVQPTSLQSNAADSLLTTVIRGMGCGPMSDLPSWTTRAGGSLITIPENSIIPPTPIWGVAPSFDSNTESSESLSHVHYDNFEMVLDEYNLESDKERERLDDSMKIRASEEVNLQSLQEQVLFCQPCDISIEKDRDMFIETKNEKIEGEISLVDYQQISLEEDVRILDKEERSQNKKDRYKGAIRSTNLGSTQIPNNEKVKKTLFHRKSQKIKQKNAAAKAISFRFEKLLSKSFNKNKKKNTRKKKNEDVRLSNHSKKRNSGRKAKNEEVKLLTQDVTQTRSNKDNEDSKDNKDTDVKKGRWKCATDATSDKVYFYHTGTKEVSWEKPESFVEWRVTVDQTNGKTCFVNRITKEATWDKPEGVEEWKEVKDANTGDSYYYSIFTRETSWIKPNNSIKPKEDSDTINRVTEISKEKVEVVDEKVEQKTEQKKTQSSAAQPDIEEAYLEAVANTDQPDIEGAYLEAVANVQDSITEDNKIHTEASKFEHEMNDFLPDISTSPNVEKLASLLSKYCANEKGMNLQLMQKAVGQEALVIRAIEALVDDTPYDELQLSISSYVKTAIQSISEEPYDENFSNGEKHGPPVTGGLSNLKRAYTMASSTMSLQSRAVSHMTAKSGFTCKTNGTAETCRMTNRTKKGNKNLDQCFDEDSTTDEDDGQKLIFDISAIEEDNLSGNRMVRNKVKEKQEAKHARRPATPPRHNVVKRSARLTSPLRRGEIDVCGNDELETESAYAADNDDETDIGSMNDGDDTISALSDSFGPAHGKRYMDYNPTPPYIVKTKRTGPSVRHTRIKQLPHTSSLNEGPLRIRPGRNRQPRAKHMEKDSLLPRYAGTRADDDSSSWDDDTVTTNPSMNADEKGGMHRYQRERGTT